MDSIPDIINGIIEHHGVKGQKWGVRRSSKQRATTAPSNPTKKPEHTSVQPATHKPPEVKSTGNTADHASVHADPHKVLKDRITELKLIDEHNRLAYNVHNADLKRVVDQMNLQKQYKELTKKPPSIGQKFVNNLVEGASKEVGKVLITALIKSPLEAKLGKAGAKTAEKTAKTVAKSVKPLSAKELQKMYKNAGKVSHAFIHEENPMGRSAVESVLERAI